MAVIAIPDCVHPLCKHWDQPDNAEIEVDKNNALMSKKAFDKLLVYSMSFPTGVYEGKMWKARIGSQWILRWYENSDEDHCSVQSRVILENW